MKRIKIKTKMKKPKVIRRAPEFYKFEMTATIDVPFGSTEESLGESMKRVWQDHMVAGIRITGTLTGIES